MTDTYQGIIEKLDRFIRKYYLNRMIRGAIIAASLLVSYFLAVVLIEHYGHFSETGRAALFWSFLFLAAASLVNYVIIPLFQMLQLGPVISRKEASRIIGRHFPEISDKLLNLLELNDLEKSAGHSELLGAAIEQKASQIKVFSFRKAIHLEHNKKYLKYLIPPALIVALLLVVQPSVITRPADRIYHYNTYYEKPAPFKIEVLNKDFDIIQGGDFTVEALVTGDQLPERLFLVAGDNQYLMKKTGPDRFSYLFSRIQNEVSFRIMYGKVSTGLYMISVLPNPKILDFKVVVRPPEYTRLPVDTLQNKGDFSVPEGSVAEWIFNAEHCDSVLMDNEREILSVPKIDDNTFHWSVSIRNDFAYKVKTVNRYVEPTEYLAFNVTAIKDQYPSIAANQMVDSTMPLMRFFDGEIADDYSVSGLQFVVKLEGAGDTVLVKELPISSTSEIQKFYFDFDFSEWITGQDAEARYYFEVFDNDAINGSKSTRSQEWFFRIPGRETLENLADSADNLLKEDIARKLGEMREIMKEAEKIKEDLMQKEQISWDEKQAIRNLIEKEKKIKNELKELFEEQEQLDRMSEPFNPEDEAILNKKEELQKRFEELIKDEELRKMFEEIERMMEELTKEEALEKIEEFQMDNKELEEALDRNLELFKQLEFERKLDKLIDKVSELAEKQKELADSTQNSDRDNLDKLAKEQQELQDEFNKAGEELRELDSLNRQLEEKNEFDPMEQEKNEVNSLMQDAQENLKNRKKGKASESQNKAGQKIQQMADNLMQMQQSMVSKSMEIDMERIRELLENLLQLSFGQEDLITALDELKFGDPDYAKILDEQQRINSNLRVQGDSLAALSKHQIMIQKFVLDKMKEIVYNSGLAMESLENSRISAARTYQQYTLKAINDITLMLSEAMEQMQQAMMAQNQGSSSCNNPGMGMPKPGQGKSTLKGLQQLQKQLNEELQRMRQGDKSSGKDRGKSSGMSEQLARNAAQQEYIRNQLQKLAGAMQEEGNSGLARELKKIAEEMEKTETELVNKMLSGEMIERQKNIEVRLLESEKALLQREKDEKRESKSGKNVIGRNPNEFIEYKRLQQRESGILKRDAVSLKPFYKKITDQYFINFDER